MKYIIEEGKHRAKGFRVTLNSNKTKDSLQVAFGSTCRYDLKGNDQKDWNKLFGWSYGILPKVFKGKLVAAHHYNSLRVAWRYVIEKDQIQLAPYIYCNGYRYTYDECKIFVDINVLTKINLKYKEEESSVVLSTSFINKEGIPEGTVYIVLGAFDVGMGYDLFPHFGGNVPAPHDIIIRTLD